MFDADVFRTIALVIVLIVWTIAILTGAFILNMNRRIAIALAVSFWAGFFLVVLLAYGSKG